jgi:membrane protein implicated in regulation of membrane protease activity
VALRGRQGGKVVLQALLLLGAMSLAWLGCMAAARSAAVLDMSWDSWRSGAAAASLAAVAASAAKTGSGQHLDDGCRMPGWGGGALRGRQGERFFSSLAQH